MRSSRARRACRGEGLLVSGLWTRSRAGQGLGLGIHSLVEFRGDGMQVLGYGLIGFWGDGMQVLGDGLGRSEGGGVEQEWN